MHSKYTTNKYDYGRAFIHGSQRYLIRAKEIGSDTWVYGDKLYEPDSKSCYWSLLKIGDRDEEEPSKFHICKISIDYDTVCQATPFPYICCSGLMFEGDICWNEDLGIHGVILWENHNFVFYYKLGKEVFTIPLSECYGKLHNISTVYDHDIQWNSCLTDKG